MKPRHKEGKTFPYGCLAERGACRVLLLVSWCCRSHSDSPALWQESIQVPKSLSPHPAGKDSRLWQHLLLPPSKPPPIITCAPSLPEPLFSLAPGARADVAEQLFLRAELSKLPAIVLTCVTSSRHVSQGSPTTQAAPCWPKNTRPGASI